MSPTEHLLTLTKPDKSRWQPMLIGLAISLGAIEVLVFLRPGELISGALMVLVLAAWIVGACAMVGFVRWFFAGEVLQAKRDRDAAAGQDKK